MGHNFPILFIKTIQKYSVFVKLQENSKVNYILNQIVLYNMSFHIKWYILYYIFFNDADKGNLFTTVCNIVYI